MHFRNHGEARSQPSTNPPVFRRSDLPARRLRWRNALIPIGEAAPHHSPGGEFESKIAVALRDSLPAACRRDEKAKEELRAVARLITGCQWT